MIDNELTNIMNEFMPLIKNYKTSRETHLLLEKIVEVMCRNIKTVEFGLEPNP